MIRSPAASLLLRPHTRQIRHPLPDSVPHTKAHARGRVRASPVRRPNASDLAASAAALYLRFPLPAAGLAAGLAAGAAFLEPLAEEGPAPEDDLPALASASPRSRPSSSLSMVTSSVAVGRLSYSRRWRPGVWSQKREREGEREGEKLV